MKITLKVSFSAILIALAFVILLLGAFLDTVTLSMAALASVAVMIAVAELGYLYATMVYAATAVIAFILLPAKDPFVVFTCFFGYYPILKSLCEKLNQKLSYVLKAPVFSLGYFLTVFILRIFFPAIDDYFKFVLILYPVLLIVFYVFDFAFTKLITLYCKNLRKRLGIDKLLR